jgi:hypothetical protein
LGDTPGTLSPLGEAVIGAARTKTFLGTRYHRLARRRGKRRALVAIGNSILTIAHRLLSDPDARFSDLGPDWHAAARCSALIELAVGGSQTVGSRDLWPRLDSAADVVVRGGEGELHGIAIAGQGSGLPRVLQTLGRPDVRERIVQSPGLSRDCGRPIDGEGVEHGAKADAVVSHRRHAPP